MALEQTVADVVQKLQANMFPNESAVSSTAVVPILGDLGWPVNNPLVVYREYPVERTRAYLALCRPDYGNPRNCKPIVFVEVKKVGNLTLIGEDQLFRYAFTNGVQLLVFTDGQQWDFYLTSGQGSYDERKIFSLNLLENGIDKSCGVFRRYLQQDDVLSHVAINRAMEDYQNLLRNRAIKERFPEAWNRMLEEPSDVVVQELANRVALLCGSVPDQTLCQEFLSGVPRYQTSGFAPPPSPPAKPLPPSNGTGFTLRGTWHPCRNMTGIMIGVLEELAKADPTFPERFANRDTRKRRNYIARNQEELYIGRPDLAMKASRKASFGWYVGTNYSRKAMENAITLACEVVGLRLGSDLVIQLDKS
jgi:hypothetical protein